MNGSGTSETLLRDGTASPARHVGGGGYPGNGVWGSGADLGGAPWYGSGHVLSLVLPCFPDFQ